MKENARKDALDRENRIEIVLVLFRPITKLGEYLLQLYIYYINRDFPERSC